MITRCDFRKGALALFVSFSTLAHADNILDPHSIPKFVTPLVVPPAMPMSGQVLDANGRVADYYEIAVRQFQQQILPAQDIYGNPLGATTVWSYGSVNHPGTLNFPAFTIEAQWNKTVRVKWINGLVDPITNSFLPHLLPVDQTLHWANPVGGLSGRDTRPFFDTTPGVYTGPVPIVTHVHGAETTEDSDGYTEAWYLPNADNLPAGYARVGSKYEEFKAKAEARTGVTWDPGTAVFDYPNHQRATTLWYHDHALGMTRLNVYAGPAGFYIIRGGPDDLGNLGQGRLPAKQAVPGPSYEIPLAIQDRTFSQDGSLRYPRSREEFDGVSGPYLPATDLSPMWNPEFFGNTMLVNGKTWPYLDVQPRRYRLRTLNGCNSRFLILAMSDPRVKVWQIGADGGFLAAPVPLSQALMGPAERKDLVVDFSQMPVGSEVTWLNLGPDGPFSGGVPGLSFDSADPSTTGQVMKFRVQPLAGKDDSTDPAKLDLPKIKDLPKPTYVRKLTINEMMSDFFEESPSMAMLGELVNGMPAPEEWSAPVTQNPFVDETEEWEIYNLTGDAHPIHVHQVQFQIVNRQGLKLDSEGEDPVLPIQLRGPREQPLRTENGFKDTVIAYPRQVTRLKLRFTTPGLFVWHCHILEHEDNEMMRPLEVRVRS